MWEWRPPRDHYASGVSSARRLANGHPLVAFGMTAGRNGSSGPTEVYEVTPACRVGWHLLLDGVETVFRAEPIDSFLP